MTRRIAAAAGAGAFVLAALGGTTPAQARSVKGSPQPELKPFVIGRANAGSDITTDSYNGTLIIAYGVATPNTEGAIDVCVVKRGARSCESNTILNTEANSSVFSSPLVTVESGGTIYVAMDECCAAPDLLFESTDGGRTFGAPAQIGPSNAPNIDTSETFGVTGYGVHMMWAAVNAGTNFGVEVDPLADPGAGQVVTAMTDPSDFFTAGLGSYNGAVIAAGSDSNEVTTASVAPPASTVFHNVGQFAGQQLLGVSGAAMLTQLTAGNQADVLRLFNGTGFGGAHVIPHTGGGGPNWNLVVQNSAGRTFVFTERNQDGYALEMQSTVAGSSWTGRMKLGDAIANNSFSGALDGIGSGAVVGTTGPATVFPVLAPQPVSFKLSKRTVSSGSRVTATGVGSYPAAGRVVELQQLEHGRWHDIATTHEHFNGHFKFHITEGASGNYVFRASVSDLPGYLLYGYSAGRSLKVT